MCVRTKTDFLFIMASSLALLGVLNALKIDNQLTIIKNDCYERLAIGQRLSPKDVYKTSHVTTVLECQLTCTSEKELCKSFSFGIGVKGNATCELSNDLIKETADLKPIGTSADTDFDLYIKKLDCTLVIDTSNPTFNKNPKPPSQQENKPPSNHNDLYDKPPTPIKPPTNVYGPLATPKPSYNNFEHVQTLVSVSPGLQRPILHPYHDILVGDGPYNYARPPFRPPALDHPYDKPYYKPRPDDYGSRPNYSPRPHRPDYDSRPGGSEVSYGHRPIPEKYGSYIPRPEDYHRPNNGDYYRPKPIDDYYRPQPIRDYYRPRPTDNYDNRPNRPNRPPFEDYNQRPNPANDYHRPKPQIDDYNYRPKPPIGDYNQKPRPPNDDYSHRPQPPADDYNYRPKPPIDDYNYRPNPPVGDYNKKPRPPIDNYNQRPRPPPDDYNHRPNPPFADYGPRPKPPSDNHSHRPNPPFDDYNSRPKPPSDDYNHRPNPPLNDYNQRPKPPNDDYSSRPQPPNDDYNHRPNPPLNDYNQRPTPPIDDYNSRPNPSSNKYSHKPNPFNDYVQKPKPVNEYDNRPSKPNNDYLFNQNIDRYDQKSEKLRPDDGYSKPGSGKPDPNNPNNGGYGNDITGGSKPKDPHSKPIITQSVGPYGESITSIITELDEACFRRVLAGKRVTRALVKRALYCERIEDCQHECADEKRFVCEGFNYRLDPSGRGKGECELLDTPLTHLDIGRDLYPDPDYDYYERDRNAARGNCKRQYNQGYGYGDYDDKPYDQKPYYDGWNDNSNRYGNRRPRPDFDDYDDGYRPSGNRRGDFAYHHSHHSEHSHDYHYQHSNYRPPPYDYSSYEPYLPPDRRPPPSYDGDRNYIDRERDKNHWGFTNPDWGSYGGSYGTNYKPHDFDRKNYYLPPTIGGTKDWGQYGGSYGNGGVNLHYNGYGHSQSFDFWGLNKYEEKFHDYGELPPYKKPANGGGSYLPDYPYRPPGGGSGSYLPQLPYKPPSGGGGGSYLPELPPKPPISGEGESYLPEPGLRPPKGGGGTYLPEPPYRPPQGGGGTYLPEPPYRPPQGGGGSYSPEPPRRPPINSGSYLPLPGKPPYGNEILPAEPRYPYNYDFLKDECSLRSATGFRLTKGIVKKFYAVPNIYECELLCFKEKDFRCASYAYRYTVSLTSPTDNCYLSNRSYKDLDYYTDLQPDRDFDIYTMNNMDRCEQPIVHGKENSGTVYLPNPT